MGKGKVLKTTISLLGKIDPSLNRALSKAQKQSGKTGKTMSKSMKDAGVAMTKSVKGFAKTAVAVFASISAAAKLKEYAQECVVAAKAQIDAETKLETVLKNVESIQIRGPNAAVEAANNLKKVASEIQQTGVIGDEVLLSGMQQLATFQLDDSTIATLSTGMADLLAQQKGLEASQGDAVSVANMIGKVMSGSTSALSRIGITFTKEQEKLLKTGDSMQRAATLAEVLQQNVGGVNKALALTDQGKLQQAENTIGDLKEQIGMKLMPIIANFATNAVPLVGVAFDKIGQVIDRVAPHVERLFSKAMPLIGKAFDSIDPAIDRISPYIEKIASKAMPMISKAFDSIGPAFDRIAPIAEEMFTFLINSAKDLEPVFTALGESITAGFGGKLPDIALMLQKLFGFVQVIAPAVITIIGVVGRALAPIVSALISVAQMILPKVMSLVQSLGSLFQSLSPILNFLGSLFGNVFGLLLRLVGAFVSGSIERLTMMINKLTGVIDFVKNFFAGGWREAWESVKSIFSNVWSSIKDIARSALAAIVKPINNIISGINKVSGAVGIKAIPAIEIPQFAAGATVTRPTLAVVGEGRDPETIVPHNRKPRSRRLLAAAAAGVGIPIGNAPQIDEITTVFYKLMDTVGRSMMPAIKVPLYEKEIFNQKAVDIATRKDVHSGTDIAKGSQRDRALSVTVKAGGDISAEKVPQISRITDVVNKVRDSGVRNMIPVLKVLQYEKEAVSQKAVNVASRKDVHSGTNVAQSSQRDRALSVTVKAGGDISAEKVPQISRITDVVNKVRDSGVRNMMPVLKVLQYEKEAVRQKAVNVAARKDVHSGTDIAQSSQRDRALRVLVKTVGDIPVGKVPKIKEVTGAVNKVNELSGRNMMPILKVPRYEKPVIDPSFEPVIDAGEANRNKARINQLLEKPLQRGDIPKASGNSYTYAPIIYVNNANDVKEVLDDDFERFKEYMERSRKDDDREVFDRWK